MKNTWTREQFSTSGTAFEDEILKRLTEASDLDAKHLVLQKAMHAIRSRTFADAILFTEEGDPPGKRTKDLFRLSALFCTDGRWKKFSELVYTPFIRERLKEEAQRLESEGF